MTGTPVQNSLHDLRSLVQFLRVPHLEDEAVFKRHIAEKRRMGKDIPRLKPDYENLKLLLGSICLRRNMSCLSLGVTFLFIRPLLSEVERRAYNSLAMSCKRSINAAISDQRATHWNTAILTALLRLRMFCNTGLAGYGVMETDAIEKFNADEINSLLQQSGEVPVCVRCSCDILPFDINDGLYQQSLSSRRRRLKCQECIQLVTPSHGGGRSSRGHRSPVRNVDRQPILPPKESSGYESVSNNHSSISGLSTYPSKLKAVLSDIIEHHSEEKRYLSPIKVVSSHANHMVSIIFSFWRRSLNLMARLLHENGIVFRQVDGNISTDRRQMFLAEFHRDPSVKVLLMTLGTGAQG